MSKKCQKSETLKLIFHTIRCLQSFSNVIPALDTILYWIRGLQSILNVFSLLKADFSESEKCRKWSKTSFFQVSNRFQFWPTFDPKPGLKCLFLPKIWFKFSLFLSITLSFFHFGRFLTRNLVKNVYFYPNWLFQFLSLLLSLFCLSPFSTKSEGYNQFWTCFHC